MGIVGDIIGGITTGAAGATPTGAITAVSSLVESVVERIWPDPVERDKAKLALQQMEQTGELQVLALQAGLLQGQIDVNKIEAASPSKFASWWRPAAGWVGVSALFFSTTVVFAIQTGVWLWQCVDQSALLPSPTLDMTEATLVLGNLLGIGVLRQRAKERGTSI